MATTLSGNGTITYNGLALAGPRVSVLATVTPKYDAAGRAVMYSVYEYTVSGVVTDDLLGSEAGRGGSGASAAESNAAIEAALTKPGGALTITGLGFADLDVSGAARDVLWGPKPKHLKFRPIAGVGAFEVEWAVEVAVNRCSASQSVRGVLGELLSLNYAVDWSILPTGCQVRTVTGTIKVASNRAVVGGAAAGATADQFRERVAVELPPPNFRRERQDYALSEDKSELRFVVVDAEEGGDNAKPPGVVGMDLTHHVDTGRSYGFAIVQHQLRGYVEAAKTHSRADALNRVLLILRDRAEYVKRAAQAQGGTAILEGLGFAEHLYGRRVEFDLRLRAWPHAEGDKRSAIPSLLKDAGFFRDAAGTNFVQWQQSLAFTAWGPRGSARLAHVTASDRIVSPCDGGTGAVIRDVSIPIRFSGAIQGITDPCPPKARSYVGRRQTVEVEEEPQVARLPAMPTAPRLTPAEHLAKYGSLSDYVLPPEGSSPTPPTAEHKVAPTTYRLKLCGFATRVCYKPDVPKSLTLAIDGVSRSLTPERVKVKEGEAGTVGAHTLYAAGWCVWYVIDEYTAAYVRRRLKKTAGAWVPGEG